MDKFHNCINLVILRVQEIDIDEKLIRVISIKPYDITDFYLLYCKGTNLMNYSLCRKHSLQKYVK